MRKTETSPGTASGLHITMILLGIAMTPVLPHHPALVTSCWRGS